MDIILESLYQQVFDTALVAIGVTDLEGKFILVNNTWCKQLGYNITEAMVLTTKDITLSEDFDESDETYKKLINDELECIQKIQRYVCKDGSSFWANVNTSPIKNINGNVICVLNIFLDINEQIKNENSLKTINHALESVNEKLKAANKEIHKKNEELQLAYFKLDDLARTDALTGLPNRRQLEELLEVEMSRTNRTKREFCICIGDIDNFKRINDTYGHDVGDIVLKDIASIFSRSTRTTDTIGRWGGEEFLFILPETPLNGTLVLMERVRQFVMSHKVQKDDLTFSVTITLGFSVFNPGCIIEEVVKQADIALYAGKKSGKNIAVAYTKGLEAINSKH
ncbi:MAG: GGDEF domain-containing protein [Candidatus Cloacimonetes bacterium]|nr:GGDEF domain-containing protein [Candidatus Cloacimonadota bacterium]